MATETKPWSRADLARMPHDGNRYEVLDGRLLVTPQASRAHQHIATALSTLLNQYLEPLRAAHVVGPAAVPFGDSELQPDVMVVPGRNVTASWEEGPAPVLVVEILSRSSRRFDLGDKRRAYLERVAVPTVWIVDHERREIHVFAGGESAIERDSLDWRLPGADESLHIDVREFFRRALGDQ